MRRGKRRSEEGRMTQGVEDSESSSIAGMIRENGKNLQGSSTREKKGNTRGQSFQSRSESGKEEKGGEKVRS